MSHDLLDLLLALVIIVIAAKACGYLSMRLGQPSVLGELMAGIILGPTLLNIFHTIPAFNDSELLSITVAEFAELGVLVLMMLAGLELHLSDLLKSGKVSAVTGTMGVFVPVLLGYGTAVLFGLGSTEALFVGIALSATSVSISAQTLMELGVLRSRVGIAMLGAAVFDDILGILLLSVASALFIGASSGRDSVGMVVFRMVAFLGGATILGYLFIPRLTRWVNRLEIFQGLIAFALVLCFLYAWASETIGGVAGITGAFLVGLMLGRTPFRSELVNGISALAYGLFVPVFFVNIGLNVDLLGISGSLWVFAITLTIIAALSKIVGCGLGGRLSGFSNRESLQLGIGMMSRGEVGLIVAAFAVSQGVLSQNTFSIIVFMVIIATLATPPMLRNAFKGQVQRQPAQGV
ncbi:MAG: cation:proton antiporter [Chloroflexi bacterium]|nr:cation:proton antiporter [Ardenticatenaceae bacterium]MBL1127093.1 cation:proton antiporter [Chloroflexota bacterium]NOG33154.1 cation:proton antiporter [Chloroflexota bacterium]GIK54948.1 MAG: sodium:proton antiporter [Chloroflexota bacterium]